MNANNILDTILCQRESNDNIKVVNLDITAPLFLLNLTTTNKKESLTEFTPDEIDNESLYKSEFTKKKFCRTSNWASGITDNEFYRQTESTLFFEYLFETVSVNTPAAFSRSNLFHGHIIYNEERKDIFIVFHAFEYPSDLEEFKSNTACKLEKTSELSSSDKGFEWRNSVYSRNNNSLFIINHQSEDFASLMHMGITLDQNLLGESVFDINYFPSEGVRAFIH